MKSISLRPKGDVLREIITGPSVLGAGCCPSVYLSGPKELAELPESGVITFKFERKSVTISSDKTPVRVELELLSIEDAVEGEKEDTEDGEDSEVDSGKALDKLMESAEEELED